MSTKAKPHRNFVVEICDAFTEPAPPAAKATPAQKPKPAPPAKPKRAAEARKPSPKPAPAKKPAAARKPAPRKPVVESAPPARPTPNYSDPSVFAEALDTPVGIGIAFPARSIFIGAPLHWG